MSEINERWKRDHSHRQRLTGAGIAGATVLWLLSFYASMPAAWVTMHEVWFTFASITTFLGALSLTIGSGFGISALLTDDEPLTGSNH